MQVKILKVLHFVQTGNVPIVKRSLWGSGNYFFAWKLLVEDSKLGSFSVREIIRDEDRRSIKGEQGCWKRTCIIPRRKICCKRGLLKRRNQKELKSVSLDHNGTRWKLIGASLLDGLRSLSFRLWHKTKGIFINLATKKMTFLNL